MATNRKKATKKQPLLWICPNCRHKFVTPNIWHSCSTYPLSYHFKDKDPIVRQLFDEFLARVERFGPVTVIPQKTRICFQVRVRFAGAKTRKHWLDCALWLKRRAEHPLFYKRELYGRTDYVHRFRLARLQDLDDRQLVRLLRESYRVGCQDHLRNNEKKT